VAAARRVAAVVLLLAAVAAVLPAGAAAHGGTVIASGSNEAYTLTVQAADVRTADGRRVVDLTAYPVRRSNGAIDLRARVEIDLGDGRTVRPVARGDGLEALIPVDRPGAWRSWAITASVTGEAGTLRIRGTPPPEPSSGPPGWLWPVSGALLVVAAAAVVRARRRSA
jgi:hypothetical protein